MYLSRHAAARRQRREAGVFSILVVVLLPLILTVLGFALGLAQIYNRKIEMQGVANAAAMAAARQLNGTAEGLDKALSKAAEAAERFKFSYSSRIDWNDGAIAFSDSPEPDSEWSAADPDDAGSVFYVKVDTSKLGGDEGLVEPIFVQLLSAFTSIQIHARAIAGRTSTKVTPLAICAFSSQAGTKRNEELVQYGFRRGVVYDLMKLNPNGDKGEHFVIDPSAPLGTATSAYSTSAEAVGPFVCTGRIWAPNVNGTEIRVTRGFPIDPLYKQLNSRFEKYEDALCSRNGAPPDINIRTFTPSWMSPSQDATRTAGYETPTRLWTVADPPSPPAGTTLKQWGALWSYAKAVKYNSYIDNKPEPASGYTPFSTTDFGTLYQAGLGTSGYPLFGATPYTANIIYPQTRLLAIWHRRVLNVPLLSCPVDAGINVKATALAVGKFFMTQQATKDSVVAEFAGIASDRSVSGPVELFP